MKQRLNLDVSTKYEVDISSAFTKSHTYLHETTNVKCVAYVHNDASMPVVLIIDVQKRTVMTVLIGKKLSIAKSTPFVDTCYAKAGITI